MGASLSVTAATKTGQTSSDAAGVSQTGGDGGTTMGNEGGAEKAPEKTWPPDLCGLEDDGLEWEDWDGPKRLRECILSPEEKQKCQDIIAQVFHPDTIMGVKIGFPAEDVVFVLRNVIEYLKQEPMLIEDVPFGVQIVGDLHGQLYDLDRIFKVDMKDGKPGWEHTKYVFLGDYVDRGRQSIEIVMALFCMKMLYPDNIFLLRGNHEFASINWQYGFYNEFLVRYEDEIATELYLAVNSAFNWLSIGAIVGNKIFCAHGGVSPSAFTRRQFRVLNKPFWVSTQHVIIHDTVWADPAIGLRGSCFNKDRGSSVFFGMDELAHALTSLQVDVLIRAHSKIKEGYEINWWTCVTVFSATDNQRSKNKGATAIVTPEGKIGFRLFEVDENRGVLERELFKLEKPWLIPGNTIEEEAEPGGDVGPVADDVTVVEREVDCDAGMGIRHYPA